MRPSFVHHLARIQAPAAAATLAGVLLSPIGAQAAAATPAAAAIDPQVCAGDCGADGAITVDEIVRLVNIALGSAPPASCAQGIASTGAVDIAAIIEAVNNALNGCRTAGERCLVASGGAATTCVEQYAAAIAACRDAADAACEAGLRGDAGTLASLLAATEAPVRQDCTAEAADRLTFLAGIDDLVQRTAQTCQKYGEDLIRITSAAEPMGLSPAGLACQHLVGVQSAQLFDRVVQNLGPRCYVPQFNGQGCLRGIRFGQNATASTAAVAAIAQGCGAAFDTLGLVPMTASPTVEGRIEALIIAVAGRAHELAQRVYPPFNLGPTGRFGAYPVGVHALALVDPSRLDTAGQNPRPINVEVYYPSTPDAVAGAARDVAQIFGISLFTTPTYRDVTRAPGRWPLVLFSPGNGAEPWNYVYLAAHLASHGFLVAGVEHHGDNLLDRSDAGTAVNRPLDLSVVIDRLLAADAEAGNLFAGAVDGDRIGAAGHSFGGYTAMALAICPFGLGALADPRVRSILPLDPAALNFLSVESPAIFSAITTPTLLFGGTLSQLAPVPPLVYDALEPGPVVTAFANLTGAVHGTFTDNCEIPDAIAEATGGLFPECEPGALPWRYARYVTNYLALNFFDATLNDSAAALARLDPLPLSIAVDGLAYESKAGDCPGGQTCSLTCAQTACGDGIVVAHEICDPPGEQGQCADGQLCNSNCTACVDCSAGTVIAPEGGVIEGTTVGGTSVLGSSCAGDSLAPERLFQWTPNASHVATIQTCGGGTDFDTTLYVREGTCVAPDLACNDDGAGAACGSGSEISIAVVAGTTYYIVVDGGTGGGSFTLSVL